MSSGETPSLEKVDRYIEGLEAFLRSEVGIPEIEPRDVSRCLNMTGEEWDRLTDRELNQHALDLSIQALVIGDQLSRRRAHSRAHLAWILKKVGRRVNQRTYGDERFREAAFTDPFTEKLWWAREVHEVAATRLDGVSARIESVLKAVNHIIYHRRG